MLYSYFYAISFCKAFLLTYLVELAVAYIYFRARPLRISGVILLANCFSLPVVWFVLPILFNDYFEYIFVAELFAFLTESLILRSLLSTSYRRSLLASLTMNLASFVVGWMFPFAITS